MNVELEQRQREESTLRERLQSYERQAQEAEKELSEQAELPQASMFNYKATLETAQEMIERQKKALAAKGIVTAENEKLKTEVHKLHETTAALNQKIIHLETEKAEEQQRSSANLMKWADAYQKATARLEELDKFFRWNPEADKMHLEYRQEQQREATRKAAEQKAIEREQQESRQREEKERQAQEQQKAQELERQRQEREQEKAQQLEWRPRGMGMGR